MQKPRKDPFFSRWITNWHIHTMEYNLTIKETRWTNMNESQRHNAEWKKPVSKSYNLYITFWKKAKLIGEKQSAVTRWGCQVGDGGRIWLKRTGKGNLRWGNLFVSWLRWRLLKSMVHIVCYIMHNNVCWKSQNTIYILKTKQKNSVSSVNKLQWIKDWCFLSLISSWHF